MPLLFWHDELLQQFPRLQKHACSATELLKLFAKHKAVSGSTHVQSRPRRYGGILVP